MSLVFVNNASSLSQAPVAPGDVTVTIDTADMGTFPVLGVGDYLYLTLEDRRVVPNLREIVRCTARADAVLTIVRAQDGTTAQSFFTGSTVSARLNRAALTTYVSAAVAAEAAARASVDAALQAQRENDITYINNQDAAEVVARNAAIAAEAAARASVDAALQAQRNSDITYINNQDAAEAAARNAAVAAEAAARAANVIALQNQRDTDYIFLTNTDANLQAQITAEVANRAAADASLSAGSFVRTGTLTSDGAGAFAISFSPPFSTQISMWSTGIYLGGGTVEAYGSLVMSPSGVSGVLLDGASVALPSTSYTWYAIGF